MTTVPNDLPEYSAPPVVEVALSVMYEGVSITSAQIGAFWQQKLRTEFPRTEDQPPLELPIEVEQERHPIQQKPTFEWLSTPKVRTWFLDASGTQLIQLQGNRITHNWRRAETDEPYPRYLALRERFKSELALYWNFVNGEDLGSPKPLQCEITYVNHILPGEVWKSHKDLANVFRFWAPPHSDEFLPRPDDGRFLVRYVIPDQKGGFAGRLHISVQPAFRGKGPDEQPILLVTLTARGKPLGDGIEGVFAFLDRGHEWIVRGFTEVTTENMHRGWRRTK